MSHAAPLRRVYARGMLYRAQVRHPGSPLWTTLATSFCFTAAGLAPLPEADDPEGAPNGHRVLSSGVVELLGCGHLPPARPDSFFARSGGAEPPRKRCAGCQLAVPATWPLPAAGDRDHNRVSLAARSLLAALRQAMLADPATSAMGVVELSELAGMGSGLSPEESPLLAFLAADYASRDPYHLHHWLQTLPRTADALVASLSGQPVAYWLSLSTV